MESEIFDKRILVHQSDWSIQFFNRVELCMHVQWRLLHIAIVYWGDLKAASRWRRKMVQGETLGIPLVRYWVEAELESQFSKVFPFNSSHHLLILSTRCQSLWNHYGGLLPESQVVILWRILFTKNGDRMALQLLTRVLRCCHHFNIPLERLDICPMWWLSRRDKNIGWFDLGRER